MASGRELISKHRTLLLTLSIAAILVGSVGYQVSAVSSGNVSVFSKWFCVSDYTYEIFTDGTNYYAKNGETCAVDYSNTNASDLIETAATGGGVIMVKAGSYTINKQTDIPSFTTIQGEGIGKTVFTVANSANILPFKNSNAVSGNTQITFKDFTLDLNGANQASNSWIALSGTSNSTIDHVEVKNPRSFAILWQAIGDPVTGIHSKNNKIINSYFSGGVISNDRVVINIQDSVVSGNTFTASPAGSNYDLSGGRTTKNVIISNNVFRDTGQMGIGLEDPRYVSVISNTFHDIASNCIQVIQLNTTVTSHDVLIADNGLHKCGTTSGAGMRLLDTFNLMVADNIINSTTTGCINIGLAIQTSISNVGVSGNQVSYCGLTGSSADGINAAGMVNSEISNNIVSFARRDGIITNALKNSVVCDNVIFNNNKGGAADPRGIGLGSSGGTPAGNLFCNNNIFYTSGNDGTMQRAIYTGNGDNNHVRDNRVNGTFLVSPSVSISGGASTILRNIGFITEASGTGTISNGNTNANVTHGLAYTPDANDCAVRWTENPDADPTVTWLSNFGATTFRVNINASPGASNLDFAWSCQRNY